MKIPRYNQSLHFSELDSYISVLHAFFFLRIPELWSVHMFYFHFIYKYREIYVSDGMHKLCRYYFNIL